MDFGTLCDAGLEELSVRLWRLQTGESGVRSEEQFVVLLEQADAAIMMYPEALEVVICECTGGAN